MVQCFWVHPKVCLCLCLPMLEHNHIVFCCCFCVINLATDISNCSYALIDGVTGVGIGPCYTTYNASTDSYSSQMWSCVNNSGVFVSVWATEGCSGSAALEDVWVPLESTGWDGMSCGNNYDCVGMFTEYVNDNASTCDLDSASYEELSVVLDTCFSNGTRSAMYGCYHGLPTKREWYNDDCSGDFDDIGNAGGCDCYDDKCQVSTVDIDCKLSDGTIYANCSYALLDDFFPLVLDRCYNSRDSDGGKYSIYYECVSEWDIYAEVYLGFDCEDTLLLAQNVCFRVFFVVFLVVFLVLVLLLLFFFVFSFVFSLLGVSGMT